MLQFSPLSSCLATKSVRYSQAGALFNEECKIKNAEWKKREGIASQNSLLSSCLATKSVRYSQAGAWEQEGINYEKILYTFPLPSNV